MTKILKNLDTIERVEADYKPHFDILTEEDNRTYQLKRIIFEELDIIERRILLLYAEHGSLRKVGEILGVSTSKTYQMVRDIRDKVKNIYANTMERNPRI